jgi:hypothetical protein
MAAHSNKKASTQLALFDLPKPIEHRKQNGRFSTYLEAALQEVANYKTLYLAEIRKNSSVSYLLRIKDEEILKLRKQLNP